MAELTNEQLSQLWRHSIPLSFAPVRFARSDKRAAYEENKGKSAQAAWTHSIERLRESGLSGGDAFQASWKDPSEILRERNDIWTDLKSDIVSWGKRGLLHAFGFQPPRQLEHVPVSIPVGFWNGSIDWKRSSAEYHGLNFIEIRLTTSKIKQQLVEKYSPPETRKGRPPITPQIELCINALVSEGKVDVTKSQASHYDMIREAVIMGAKKQKKPVKAVSNEAVRRVFSPIFKALRDTKKQ